MKDSNGISVVSRGELLKATLLLASRISMTNLTYVLENELNSPEISGMYQRLEDLDQQEVVLTLMGVKNTIEQYFEVVNQEIDRRVEERIQQSKTDRQILDDSLTLALLEGRVDQLGEEYDSMLIQAERAYQSIRSHVESMRQSDQS